MCLPDGESDDPLDDGEDDPLDDEEDDEDDEDELEYGSETQTLLFARALLKGLRSRGCVRQ